MHPPQFQGADLAERFQPSVTVWASIKTVTGKTIFQDVNTDVALSHEIYIRYRSDISTETWIEFNNMLFDIVAMENLEERKEWWRLACTQRGDSDDEAAKA